MIHYHLYKIKETDRFISANFPKVRDELDVMQKDPEGNASGMNGEIVLSYLKDHLLRKEWLAGHPALTTLLTSRHFTTDHIEALLESSRENKPFREGLETYIKEKLDTAGR